MARRPVGLEKGQQKEAGGREQITGASDTVVRALGFVLRMVGIHWMVKSRIRPNLTSILKGPSNSIKYTLQGLGTVPGETQDQQEGTWAHQGFIRIPQALGNARRHSVAPVSHDHRALSGPPGGRQSQQWRPLGG